MEDGKTVLVKQVNSKLPPRRYLVSTELSSVFSDLYGHAKNCFAFHNNKVIWDFTKLEDGDEVVVKRVSRVVLRKDGKREYVLSVRDLNQTFFELLNSSVSLKSIFPDFNYCYLRYNSEEVMIDLSDPLRMWLWKEETIGLITEIEATVVFEGEKLKLPYKLSDTVEAVQNSVAKDGSYFVYDDEGEVMSCSDLLMEVVQSVSVPADSLCFVVKSAMFITNLKNKVDLTKYNIMRNFMRKSNLCDVQYNNNPVDPLLRTSKFVYDSFYMDCHLHVVAEPNLNLLPYFSITGGSISKVAKDKPNEILKNVEESEIYFHWLTIAIHDAKQNIISDDTMKTVTDNIQKVLSSDLIEEDKVLIDHESSFTAFLCQEFQKCFGEVICLHQATIKHKPNNCRPDFYFASEKLRPLLVGDFKPFDFESAKVQTLGYCMTVANEISGKPFIAMPCTKELFVMYVCFSECNPLSQESSLLPIKIFQADPKNSDKMKQFIKVLIFAINELSSYNPDKYEVEPQKGLKLTDRLHYSRRVYKKDKKVYKLYDRDELHDKEEIRLNLGFSYLKPERKQLSKDGRFYMLTYDFIEQKERQLRKYEDYVVIMKTLDKLHQQDYVHSDVRDANLLFPQNGTDAMLIDFDLMDKVGTVYPDGFNRIKERHPEAVPGKPRKIIHDRYALLCVMQKELFYDKLDEPLKQQLQDYKNSILPLSSFSLPTEFKIAED